MHPKNFICENKDYEEFVKSFPCLGCNSECVDGHHAYHRRNNSYMLLPLCRLCHIQAHRGEETWQIKTGIYYDNEIMKMLMRYIEKSKGG